MMIIGCSYRLVREVSASGLYFELMPPINRTELLLISEEAREARFMEVCISIGNLGRMHTPSMADTKG